MPVAEVPGNRNWGYDGASLYAPQSSYGGPTGLKKLVDACHQHGLAVVLDVVYNHLGPEGNYLPEFAPCFTDAHHTPWGKAINFDGPESDGVRRFVIDNALYWLTEYHVDALRLDAIHGIYDFGARHILDELSRGLPGSGAAPPAPGLVDCRERPRRCAHHQSPRRRRLRARRAMARRFSPRALCPAHRPEGRLSHGFRRHRRSVEVHRAKVLFSTGNIRAIAVATSAAHRKIGQESSSLASFRTTIRSPTPAGANGSRAWFPPDNRSWRRCLPCARLSCRCCSWERNTERPRLFSTSPASTTPIWLRQCAKGAKKNWGRTTRRASLPIRKRRSTFERCKLDWSKTAISPHAEILRLYRDLISLRKQHPSLANCRKDLTEIQFDEQAKWLVMKRVGPLRQRGPAGVQFLRRGAEHSSCGCRPLVAAGVVDRRYDLRRQSGATSARTPGPHVAGRPVIGGI